LHAVKTPCKTLIAEWSFPIGSFNWDRLEKLAFNFSVKNSLFNFAIYKQRRIYGLLNTENKMITVAKITQLKENLANRKYLACSMYKILITMF